MAIEALDAAQRPEVHDRRQETQPHPPYRSQRAVPAVLRSLPKITAERSQTRALPSDRLKTAERPASPAAARRHWSSMPAAFPPEGDDCDASLLCDAFRKGWRRFITFELRGQRFLGCGLGPDTDDVTIDVYGSSGDYLGSGIDGLTITVHGNAQDQLGQIIKRGKLVVHGDVGQTFMYGAKGGDVFVLGNAAGRPLINSVGRPKVVINGTCLDFLAESFMAGDPLERRRLRDPQRHPTRRGRARSSPWPSPIRAAICSRWLPAGAIYVRDPHHKVVDPAVERRQVHCR